MLRQCAGDLVLVTLCHGLQTAYKYTEWRSAVCGIRSEQMLYCHGIAGLCHGEFRNCTDITGL